MLWENAHASHPGYGCWLSGIDVDTQMTNQQFNDPYLAVVVSVCTRRRLQLTSDRPEQDGLGRQGRNRGVPHISQGQPRGLQLLSHDSQQDYQPPQTTASEYQSIPMDKIEDFGVHMDAYYPLKVEIFKTKLDEQLLDLLWNKYWVATLSQSLIVSVSWVTQGETLLKAEPRIRHVASEGSWHEDQICHGQHAVWRAWLCSQSSQCR